MTKYEIKTEKPITNCLNCIFRRNHYGHGECWEECSHPDNGRGSYENILYGCQGEFKKTPIWCPLGLGEIDEEETREEARRNKILNNNILQNQIKDINLDDLNK